MDKLGIQSRAGPAPPVLGWDIEPLMWRSLSQPVRQLSLLIVEARQASLRSLGPPKSDPATAFSVCLPGCPPMTTWGIPSWGGDREWCWSGLKQQQVLRQSSRSHGTRSPWHRSDPPGCCVQWRLWVLFVFGGDGDGAQGLTHTGQAFTSEPHPSLGLCMNTVFSPVLSDSHGETQSLCLWV